jgi:hypothetical protein
VRAGPHSLSYIKNAIANERTDRSTLCFCGFKRLRGFTFTMGGGYCYTRHTDYRDRDCLVSGPFHMAHLFGGPGGVGWGGDGGGIGSFSMFYKFYFNTLSIYLAFLSGESLSANLLLRWRERGDSMEHGVGGESTLHSVLKVRLSRQSILYMPESRPMPISPVGIYIRRASHFIRVHEII